MYELPPSESGHVRHNDVGETHKRSAIHDTVRIDNSEQLTGVPVVLIVIRLAACPLDHIASRFEIADQCPAMRHVSLLKWIAITRRGYAASLIDPAIQRPSVASKIFPKLSFSTQESQGSVQLPLGPRGIDAADDLDGIKDLATEPDPVKISFDGFYLERRVACRPVERVSRSAHQSKVEGLASRQSGTHEGKRESVILPAASLNIII